MRYSLSAVFFAGMLHFSSNAVAVSTDFDFSGIFAFDNDVELLSFNLESDSNVTIFSSSWGDDLGDGDGWVERGGFDPSLGIWNSSGELLRRQDDGNIEGTTQSGGVDYTYGIWDVFIEIFLTAGDYTASITQYSNFAESKFLNGGFEHDGNTDFTFDNGYGPEPFFNGVWGISDPNSDPDPRTGVWEFHILAVESASQLQVPEPATIALIALGLVGIGYKRYKAV